MGWIRRRLLGQGAFGKVYLAQSRELLAQRRRARSVPLVALKTAPREYSASLLDEKEAYESIGESRYILNCLGSDGDVNEHGQEEYCLILEYAPLGPLSHIVRNCVSERRASYYAKMMLFGLTRVHQRGWVHCDLKPDNILAFPSRHPVGVRLKLSDFGRAKRYGVSSSALRGTLMYSSPESVERGEHEPPSDIWSFGCIIYWMLTGVGFWDRYAHNHPSVLRTIIAAFDESRLILPPLSTHAKSFLTKCLRSDPSQRWTTRDLLGHPFILSYWPPQ